MNADPAAAMRSAVAQARSLHGPPARAARWAVAQGSGVARRRQREHLAHLSACEACVELVRFYACGGASALRPFGVALALMQRCEPGRPLLIAEAVLSRLCGYEGMAEFTAAIDALRDRLLETGGIDHE